MRFVLSAFLGFTAKKGLNPIDLYIVHSFGCCNLFNLYICPMELSKKDGILMV